MHIQPAKADIDPLHQQLHDAGLLGGKQFVPERIKMHQGCAGLGLGYFTVMGLGRFPCADDDLRLVEYGAQLVDHGRLDVTRRHAADRTGARTVFQHGLADVIAIQPVLLAGMAGRKRRPVRPEQQPP